MNGITTRHCKIRKFQHSRKSISYIPVTSSIKLLMFEYERKIAHHGWTRKTSLLSLHTIRTCNLCTVRPRYETKTKESPILHCHDQYHRKDTFTLHRHRESIALNGSKRRGLKYLAPRKLTDYWSIDSRTHTAHSCYVTTFSTLKPIQSVALLPGAEIRRDEPRSSNNRESPVVWNTKGDGTEEKRRDETGRERIARRRGAGRH